MDIDSFSIKKLPRQRTEACLVVDRQLGQGRKGECSEDGREEARSDDEELRYKMSDLRELEKVRR